MTRPGMYPTRRAALRALAPLIAIWVVAAIIILKACT